MDSEGKILGRLSDRLSLDDVIQVLHGTRRTATLTLDHEGERGTILFQEGCIIHTSLSRDEDTMIPTVPEIEGEEALLELLGWVDAAFILEEEKGSATEPTVSSDDRVSCEDEERSTSPETGGCTEMEPTHREGVDSTPAEPGVLGVKTPADEDEEDGLKVESWELASLERQPERWKLGVGAVSILAVAVLLPAAFFLTRHFGETGTALGRSSPAAPSSEQGVEATTDPAEGPAREDGLAATDTEADSEQEVAEASPSVPPSALETAPVAASAAYGYLLAVANPWAEVFVDGQRIGETPMDRIRLPAGEHTLTLSNQDFVGIITDRVLIPRDGTITKKYSFHDCGYLQVVVQPWADVYVDGRLIGQTPLSKVEIPVGRHQVTLRHPDRGEKQVAVDIQFDQVYFLRIDI